jgi:uncharacterized protein YegL
MVISSKIPPKIPGRQLAKRPLHFCWLLDVSGSMEGSKIEALNTAVHEAIPHMQKEAGNNPYADVLVNVITFSSGANWMLNSVPISQFEWHEITAGGETDMGKAFTLLADFLKIPPMTDRGLPPVIVLVSDGQPTDDYATGLQTLFKQPWAIKAVRISIAIGQDANLDVLQKFINHNERKPITVNNPESLMDCVKWASTAVLKNASSPKTSNEGDTSIPEDVLTYGPTEAGNDPDFDEAVW